MCGGYELAADPEAIVRAFRVDRSQLELPLASAEHYPKQSCPIVVARLRPDGAIERVLGPVRWGLVPFWADDPSIGDKLYNARAETLTEKPAFRDSFAHRRCVVPVSAFYEWQGPRGYKQRFTFRASTGELLALAGLWSLWRSASGERLGSFTIVTVAANALIEKIHDRMPALLVPEAIDVWLDPKADLPSLSALLRPAPDGFLSAAPG